MPATFTVGLDYAKDASGWSAYTLTGTNGVDWGVGTGYSGSGPRILLVSFVSGVDNASTNDGSLALPFKTMDFAGRQSRGVGCQDWILLACGETHPSSNQPRFAGISTSKLFLVSNYNKSNFNANAPIFDDKNNAPGTRPICIPTGGAWYAGQGGGAAPAGSGDLIAVIGLEFYAPTRDPSQSTYNAADAFNTGFIAIEQAFTYTFLLVENCRFHFCSEALESSLNTPTTHGTGMIWRRNVMHDCYMTRFNGGMMHMANCDAPKITENFFDKFYNDSLTIAFQVSAANATATAVYTDYAAIHGFIDDGSGGGSPSGVAGTVLTVTSTDNGFLTFTSTGSSISGTTLTIGTLTNGFIEAGMFINGASIPGGVSIISGSGSTWTISSNLGTIGAEAINGAVNDGYQAPLYGVGIPAGVHLTGNYLGTNTYRVSSSLNISTEQITVGPTYTVNTTISAGNNLICTRSGSIPATNGFDFPRADSGTLFKVSGTGDSSIGFSHQSLTFPGQYGFIHNVYHSAFGNEFDPAALYLPMTFNGNVTCRDPSSIQFRSGGQICNTLWVRNPSAGAIGQPTTTPVVVSDNVLTEALGNASQNYETGWPSGRYSPFYDQASVPILFDNNIYTHTSFVTGGDGIEWTAGANATIRNQIFYKWNTPLLPPTSGGNSAIGGIKTYGSITPGSGAAAMPTFVGKIDSGAGVVSTTSLTIGTGNQTLNLSGAGANLSFVIGDTVTIADSANPSTNTMTGTVVSLGGGATPPLTINVTSTTGSGTIASWLISGDVLTVTSVTGTPIGPLQGLTWSGIPGGQKVNIWAMNDLAGLTGSGGTGTYKIYVANGIHGGALFVTWAPPGTTFTILNYFLPMSYAPGHSGNGTGASAYITITGAGAGVATVQMWDGTSSYEVPTTATPGVPGINYAAGDVLTATVPGIATWSVVVGSVSSVDTSVGNQLYPNGGPSPFVDPERTIAKYMQTFGLGNTTDDFLAAWRLQEKANWNPQLTADVVIDWIQGGFQLPVLTGQVGAQGFMLLP